MLVSTLVNQISFLHIYFKPECVLFSRLKLIGKSYPFKVPQECGADGFTLQFETAAFPFFSLFSLIYLFSGEDCWLETSAIASSVKVFESCMEDCFTRSTCYYSEFIDLTGCYWERLGAFEHTHRYSVDSISCREPSSPHDQPDTSNSLHKYAGDGKEVIPLLIWVTDIEVLYCIGQSSPFLRACHFTSFHYRFTSKL